MAGTAPPLVTQATPEVRIGGVISDAATLSEGEGEGGAIEFQLFSPGAPACTGTPLVTWNVPVTGDGDYSSGSYAPTEVGTYHWTAIYTKGAGEPALEGECGDADESSTVTKALPTVATDAGADVEIGGALGDVATVAGGHSPTGTVSFRLYGPGDTACANTPVFTATKNLGEEAGEPGVARSGPFTPSEAGEYRWIASYSGDADNEAIAGTCGDPDETVTVAKAAPAIASQASPGLRLGDGAVDDTATVSGGHQPSGSVEFALFGPADPTCAGAPVFTDSAPLAADGTATSADFVPANAGTYHWVATYGGDVNNEAAGGSCGDSGESVTIAKAVPSFAASAVERVTIGDEVRNSASIVGAVTPTGTVSFQLYGPTDPTCSRAAIFTTAMPIHENGSFASEPFLPAAPGAYHWVAAYSGDANNEGGRSGCGAAGGTSTVAKATPTLNAAATASIELGGAVAAAALVGDGHRPTGTVSFQLYAAGDGTCAGAPVFAATVALAANGKASSGSFTPAVAGSYGWRVSYSGDADNDPVAGACASSSTVRPRPAVSMPAAAVGAEQASTEPDLRLKLKAPKRARAGAAVTYSLSVANGGDATAKGVELSARLSGAATGVPMIEGARCKGSRALTCKLGALAAGASVEIEVTIPAKAAGRLTLTGAVTSTGGDVSPGNDRAAGTVAIERAKSPVRR